jgi:hypothetical protein
MTVIGVIGLALIWLAGREYYTAPLDWRVRDDLHAWLRPSGYVGQTAGIVAFLFFAFIWLYPIRKRFARRLDYLGSVGRWLDLHIVAGLLIPPLVATHAAWRFTGLIGLGFAAMVMVCASGVVGRYLYVRIPRSKSGIAMSLDEVRMERRELVEQIVAATGLPEQRVRVALEPAAPAPGSGLLATLRRMIVDDVERARATRRLMHEVRGRASEGGALERRTLLRIGRLARRQIALDQQARMLDATHSVFRFWHAAHRPIALAALVAVVIHVIVVIAMGSTWFS